MAFCTWAISPASTEIWLWITWTCWRRSSSSAAAAFSRFLASASSCRCWAMLDWISSSCFCRSETLAADTAGGTLPMVAIRHSDAVSRLTVRRSRAPSRDFLACFALFTERPPLFKRFGSHVQMLADGEQAAQAAHQAAAQQAAAEHGGPHGVQGHQRGP